jgi:nicotinic acid mononucleotide adenylyltransferase
VGTADLLDMLRNSNPYVDFSLLLGSDTFLDLTSWKWRRSRDVIQLVDGRLLVIQRKGVENTKVDQKLQLVNEMVQDPNAAQTLHISSLSSVSSTLVRSSTDEQLLNDSVTPDVLQYMKDNKLYAFSDADD